MISAKTTLFATIATLAIIAMLICYHQSAFSFRKELTAFETMMSTQTVYGYDGVMPLPYDYEHFTKLKTGKQFEREVRSVWNGKSDVVIIIRTSPNNDKYIGDLLYATGVSSIWHHIVCKNGFTGRVEQIQDNNDFNYIVDGLGKLTDSVDIRHYMISDETWWFVTRRSHGTVKRYVTYAPSYNPSYKIQDCRPEYRVTEAYRLLFTRMEEILDNKSKSRRNEAGGATNLITVRYDNFDQISAHTNDRRREAVEPGLDGVRID